jgi:hypothetical protein
MKYIYNLIICTIIAAFFQGHAQDNTLVEINKIRPSELEIEGFKLDSEQELDIDVVGLHQKNGRHEIIIGTAWILNANTREVVWKFKPDNSRRGKLEANGQRHKITLHSGNYEVYYATYSYFRHYNHWAHHGRHGIGYYISHLFAALFDGDYDYDNYDYYDEFYRNFKIVIKGKGKKLNTDEIESYLNNLRKDAIISLSAFKDNLYLSQGFEIKKPLDFEIYAIGEAREDGNFDYGWILNTETKEKIWELDYWDSEQAGGSLKNRMMKESVSLPAGRYAAIYISDDSHSPEKWNSALPYDPAFWGMTIQIADQAQKQYISKFDYQNINPEKVIFSLTQLRDDEFTSKGFTVKKPSELRIYAIGEGQDGEMFDYGWIVDAKTRKKVWEMEYDETEHVGGSQKNRLIDEVISFEKGNYIAYFVTDDSHSYRYWNASQPYDPQNWGMTILAANENFSPNDFGDYEEEKNTNILAQIVRVQAHNHKRAKLSLKKDTEVRIYAIGEGMRGDMYDYGWIEDKNTGRVIWEMSYRMTDYAGGARKNRIFNDTIILKAGEYEVYYETDDSHSFNDWNDSPPWDPINWGITVYSVE